VETR
jgi:hypothetical protein